VFKRILIANRGEIACRVAATAARLGIETVAVYSDADAQAAHVAACNHALRLGPAPARDSYLKGEAIIAAALQSGAQAIHPGYGFLSENDAFASAVREAGLVFIGPPPEAIRAMGSKSAAKALMEQAGVPLVPGYHGDRQEADYLRGQADAIGYPVIIKASAGGGGKGMRIVEQSADFESALASCRREALSAFGSDQVLVERYLRRPRHIEVQVFADRHGQALHLFERDCSVQRRHQKVVEEAPAPGLSDAQRTQMGEAAIAAARAVGYEGAGTVEFIAEQDGRFYFMEKNTRLQVEHPVTEMITGLDLVEWQLRVAAGEPLPLAQSQLERRGHAIEVRLYAENPERGFLPSTGQLRALHLPPAIGFSVGTPGIGVGEPASIRIDSGVRAGDTITPHYDPMIAKLIAWGSDRDQARARMAHALSQVRIAGVSTNAEFLFRLMHAPAFASADLDTGLIERDRALLLPEPASLTPAHWALAASAWLAHQAACAPRRAGWTDPWSVTDAWRMHGQGAQWLKLAAEGERCDVRIEPARSGLGLTVFAGTDVVCVAEPRLDAANGEFSALVGSSALRLGAVIDGDNILLFEPGCLRRIAVVPFGENPDEAQADAGSLAAPMPGKVVALMVAVGDQVERGQPLAVLEAMKMEHVMTAPQAGRVTAILHPAGSQVQEGHALLAIEPLQTTGGQ
jgi:3-methylcrotonyl-CoA carboxylase alpha subunit